MKIPIKVEEHVTWKALLFLLASFALFVLVTMNSTISKAETINQTTKAETQAALSALKQEVQMNKVQADAGVAEVRKDIKALYDFMLTRQRQDRLEKPK